MRLIITVNQDWFFLSHRLPIARAARDAGAEIIVIAGDSGKGPTIRAEGFDFIPLPIGRKSLNPFEDLRTLFFLWRAYRRLRPDLVHQVTIKPVLYGSLAARLAGGTQVINAVSGLGYVFTSGDVRASMVRPFVKVLYRFALGGSSTRTVFQNPDDLADFVRMGLVGQNRTTLIRGSGVDCERFRPTPEPKGRPVVLLASRLLWDKGIKEFVEAARQIRLKDQTPRFVLAGAPDAGNPSSIPVEQIEAWTREGVVEWWGQREDMPSVLAQATIVVLPTVYGEGVPKILLEAAASGRAIVATDTRGCREIVRSGINGVLVPPGDGLKLVEAIGRLLASPTLREGFGIEGRRIAEREFAEPLVVRETLRVYRELLSESGSPWPSVS